MKKNTLFAFLGFAFLFILPSCKNDHSEEAKMEEIAKNYCGCMQEVIDIRKHQQKNITGMDSAAILKWKSEATDAMIAANDCKVQRVDTLIKLADIELRAKYGNEDSKAYIEATGRSHEAFILGLKKHCPAMYNMFETDDSNAPK